MIPTNPKPGEFFSCELRKSEKGMLDGRSISCEHDIKSPTGNNQ